MSQLHNMSMSYSLESLKNPKMTQAEARAFFQSINYGIVPGLTTEEQVALMRIAHPDTPIAVDNIHTEEWLDDDSVPYEEKAAYVEQLFQELR